MTKQAEDMDTLELPGVGPYLVITTVKKGFREFKTDKVTIWRSAWDSRIDKAYQFELGQLPELLNFAYKSSKVTVALVDGDYFTVLGQAKYPVELGQRKKYLR